MLKTKKFFSTVSEAKREVKSHPTFGCFEAKFNFQMAIKSADLGLDEKFLQEIHYHTWDYHPCHFGANMYTDPPTFMICGINFFKMLKLKIFWQFIEFRDRI